MTHVSYVYHCTICAFCAMTANFLHICHKQHTFLQTSKVRDD